MSRLTLMRTEQPLPEGAAMEAVKSFLFGNVEGFTESDRKAWNRFWNRVKRMEPGELWNLELVFPRSGPFHRLHMSIEQAVFNAQDRFQDFEIFRAWLKVGAGWVTWAAGPKGGVVPIPKSISYAKADGEEFKQYHDQVMAFLRGEHAAKYLWSHLSKNMAAEMMNSLLSGFGE